MGRVIIDDIDRLRITLVREDRVNFRYDGILYSIQNNMWDGDGEDGINIKKNINGKFKYVAYLGGESLKTSDICRLNNGKKFKNNVIYSHIDKGYFVRKLYNYGFIDAGLSVELEYLKRELELNTMHKEKLAKEYKSYFKRLLEKRNNIIARIEEIEKVIKNRRYAYETNIKNNNFRV